VAERVPIFGPIPRVPGLAIPERHLGLHLPDEARPGYADRLATLVEEHIDLDRLLEAGRTAPPPLPARPAASSPAVRIGVARDEAFCFHCADNLELLEQAGAELIEFSPSRDPLPEGLDGLYIGGGYPSCTPPSSRPSERSASSPMAAVRSMPSAAG
jgi:cobyrinic acid a,c-diamide synthase